MSDQDAKPKADGAESLSTAGLCLMAKEMEMAMDGTSDGRKAHVDWESVRGNENECDAESRIRHSGGVRSRAWWDGWFERSDEWRDEIGERNAHDTLPALRGKA